MMDEGRKRVLWICASILAAPKLADIQDGKNSGYTVDVTYDAILKAERIIGQIDLRWKDQGTKQGLGAGAD
jgi:hypothetical protein